MEITLKIGGMMCSHCTARVETALKAVPGVSEAVVMLTPGGAVVSGEELSFDALKEAVENQGFDVLD